VNTSGARARLREVLRSGEYVDPERVSDLTDGSGSLFENLRKKTDLSPRDRAAFFCELFERLPFFSAKNIRVARNVLDLVPKQLAERYRFLPVAFNAGTLTVAVANPLDLQSLDAIGKATRCEIVTLVGADDEIAEAIEANYKLLEEERKARVRMKQFAASEKEMQAVAGTAADARAAAGPGAAENEENITRLVTLILNNAIHRGASDIHLEPFEEEFKLRFRQDGKLVPVFNGAKGVFPPLVSRIKIMANLDIAEHRIPQDGRLKITFEDRDIDFRVSVLPTYHGEKVVLRILDKGSLKLEFTDLGFEPQERDVFVEAISKPNGICLVTGPTGSGKSTTLYSALNNLNEEDTNLITLEDPVEYNIEGINQIQCNAKVGLTFASGLRSILRQDPDVIMVGEIRDLETADIAIKAALTGHLVLSTLHTNDAPGAVSRLLDMGIEPFMLAASLNLCQAQRLVRRLCAQCKKAAKVPQTFFERNRRHLPPNVTEHTPMYVADGCQHCNGSGYKGRTSVVEMMPVTESLKQLIADGANLAQIKKEAAEEGMITLYENGLKKVYQGLTSLEEVLRTTTG
jgi:type IV pilus assembly protein PilB